MTDTVVSKLIRAAQDAKPDSANTTTGNATPANNSPAATPAVRVTRKREVIVGFPGNTKPVPLEEGRSYTAAEVIGLAGFSAAGNEVRINGRPSNPNSPVNDQDTVWLLKPVSGNTN